MGIQLNAKNLFLAGAAIQAAHGLFAIALPDMFLNFYSVPNLGADTRNLLAGLLGLFGMFSLHSAGQMCQFAFTCTRAQMNITAMVSLCWLLFHVCATFLE